MLMFNFEAYHQRVYDLAQNPEMTVDGKIKFWVAERETLRSLEEECKDFC